MKRTYAAVAAVAVVLAGTGVAALSRDGRRVAVVATTATPAPTTPAPSPPSPTAAPAGAVRVAATGATGTRVELALDDGDLPTATVATLTVEVAAAGGHPRAAEIAWGDGSVEAVGGCGSTPLPGPPHKRPSGLSRQEFTHAWRHPGTYTVVVRVASLERCEDTTPAEIRVTVRRGRTVSNGPAPAVAAFGVHRDRGDATAWTASGWLRDADGWVTGATIDWGDGTRSAVRQEDACDDGKGRHFPLNGYLAPFVTHRYASSGTYPVTIRFESAGCDGRDEQTGSATATADVG